MKRQIQFGVLILAGFFSLFGCSKKNKPYEIADVFTDLRSAILNTSPQTIGLDLKEGSPQVWALIMETGHPEAIVSCVAGKGGNVSIYISNGGAVLGTGGFPEVLTVADELIDMVPNFMTSLAKTSSYPLPQRDFVRFYALAGDGVYSTEVKDQVLFKGDHALSPLYLKAHELMTKAKEVQDRNTAEQGG